MESVYKIASYVTEVLKKLPFEWSNTVKTSCLVGVKMTNLPFCSHYQFPNKKRELLR